MIDGGAGLKIKPAFLANYSERTPFIADFSIMYIKDTIGLGC